MILIGPGVPYVRECNQGLRGGGGGSGRASGVITPIVKLNVSYDLCDRFAAPEDPVRAKQDRLE
ncbi:hypothetical protein X777_14463, partial [Ooceraea biroi]